MTSRSVAAAISIMPADGEQRQRVVLARRQLLPLDDLVRKQHRQDADDAEDEVDEEREVVGADDAEALRVAVPQEDRRERRADQADEPEAGDRHALARLAERLGEHRGAWPTSDDDEDRDDGGEVAHCDFDSRRSRFRLGRGGRRPATSRLEAGAGCRRPAPAASSGRLRSIDLRRPPAPSASGRRPGGRPSGSPSRSSAPSSPTRAAMRSGSLRFFSFVIGP